MPDLRRKNCVGCGRNEAEVGALSWTGKCGDCGTVALYSNVSQMVTRSGPNFDRWRRSMAACVGGVLVDEKRNGA